LIEEGGPHPVRQDPLITYVGSRILKEFNFD
jgi:hypothetical protein